MKEKLKNLIENVKLRQTRAIVIVVVSILTVISTGVSAASLMNKNDLTESERDASSGVNSSEIDSIVSVVGAENSSIIGNTKTNNSWSGEIISLSNLQVQPDREGTISEWYVRIGERVGAGQVIGKLSRPPQTPEMVSMLSEKSQMASESRTTFEALRTYTEKRIVQLKQLRVDTEKSNKQKIDLLGSNTGVNDNLLSSIASKKKMTQVVLQGSITKVFPMMYGQNSIPPLSSIFVIQMKPMVGVLNQNLRNNFSSILVGALSDLKDINLVPEKSGLLYFDAAIKLANTSIADGETLTEADLTELKTMLIEDQSEFITMLGEIKSMELEKVDTQRESIDTLAEIDSMIFELEKELAMSAGDVVAKEKAYITVKGSITGGYSIVAPNRGVVSSIMKKPGEFVGPGMPVATVTSDSRNQAIVRIQMPNNIQKPEVGEILSVIRPGFGTDVQKARLVGIGSSLDDGSYMADAVFTEETKWPVGSSVRVLAPANSSTITIKYSSIFWKDEGIPTVWQISEAGRIFAKKLTVGRTLGPSIEVYTGLQNGDRYVTDPALDIKEGMFIDDFVKTSDSNGGDTDSSKSGKDKEMGGMEM
jgi:multidrug efflux pump subunit AcrA (membrane-fusion protein)